MSLNYPSSCALRRQQQETGTHSLDWHLLLPVANPSTAAAISAVSALPGTAEHTEMMTDTGDVGVLPFSTPLIMSLLNIRAAANNYFY